MNDEMLKQVEYRLNGKISDLSDSNKDIKLMLGNHIKDHDKIEDEVKEQGKTIAGHDAVLPGLATTIEKLNETVNNLAIAVTRMGEQTKAITESNNEKKGFWKELLIGFLLIILGYIISNT